MPPAKHTHYKGIVQFSNATTFRAEAPTYSIDPMISNRLSPKKGSYPSGRKKGNGSVL
jgi:hypothetical protein